MNERFFRSGLRILFLLLGSQHGLAQSSTAEKAVELLSLSMKCPLEPVTIQGNETLRLFEEAIYQGDSTTFKVMVKRTSRYVDTSTNKTTVKVETQLYQAAIDKLDPTSLDIYKLGGSFPANRTAMTIKCAGQNACIAESEPTRPTRRTILTERMPDLAFCDEENAQNAKMALQTMIKGINR